MKIIFFILLLFFSSIVFGQYIQPSTTTMVYPVGAPQGKIENDDGYILTNANDTLHGTVILYKADNFINVKLMQEGATKIQNYRADKIRAFYVGAAHYESLILNNTHYFFKVVLKGQISLFEQTNIKNTKRSYYLLRKDYLVKVPKMHFRKNMIEYFKDCDELCKRIKHKEFKFNDLDKIVLEYNNWYALRNN